MGGFDSSVLLVVGVLCLIGKCSSEKIVNIIPDTIDSWTDNTYYEYSYAVDKSVPYINVTHKVLKTIPELELHIESEIRAMDNRNHFVMSNATISVCDLLEMKAIHPMAVFIFAMIKQHGNVPEKCPIEPGTYSMNKVWPPLENIPSHLPMVEGEFKMQLFSVEAGTRHMILNKKVKAHTELGDASGHDKLFNALLNAKG